MMVAKVDFENPLLMWNQKWILEIHWISHIFKNVERLYGENETGCGLKNDKRHLIPHGWRDPQHPPSPSIHSRNDYKSLRDKNWSKVNDQSKLDEDDLRWHLAVFGYPTEGCETCCKIYQVWAGRNNSWHSMKHSPALRTVWPYFCAVWSNASSSNDKDSPVENNTRHSKGNNYFLDLASFLI